MSQFIVQNTATPAKKVSIFNLSIEPGQIVNLLNYPGVTENTLKDSLGAKGELRKKLSNKDLTVVSCTVLFPSGDSGFTEFLTSVGLGQSIAPAKAEEYLTTANWYVDPVNGSDNNHGDTLDKPLKTFQEWQSRVGSFTTLAPTGGTLIINILNDLPNSDFISFKNIMKNGTTCRVRGQEKVLTTGTLSNVIVKSRLDNIPWQVVNGAASAADYWTQYLGKKIVITSGAAAGASAWIVRDMGAKTAHVTEWMAEGINIDGGAAPSDNKPQAGDTFKVVDYTQAQIGAMTVGYESAGAQPPNDLGIPVGGIVIEKFHLVDGDAFTIKNFPLPFMTNQACGAFGDCVIDHYIEIPGGAFNASAGNCLFRGQINQNEGTAFFQFGGGYLPFESAGYPGALRIEPGAVARFGSDVQFVGDVNNGALADVQVAGEADFGSCAFWNTHHTIFPLPHGLIWTQTNDFLGDGSLVDCNLWGNGNNARIFMFAGGTLILSQFKFNDGYTLTAQPLELYTGDGYTAAVDFMGNPGGHVFDALTGTFSTRREVSWQKLITSKDSGGFQLPAYHESSVDGDFYSITSTAIEPNTSGKVIVDFTAFIPA